MKDVGTITRVHPDKRVEALMKFRRRIADNTEVIYFFFFGRGGVFNMEPSSGRFDRINQNVLCIVLSFV